MSKYKNSTHMCKSFIQYLIDIIDFIKKMNNVSPLPPIVKILS